MRSRVSVALFSLFVVAFAGCGDNDIKTPDAGEPDAMPDGMGQVEVTCEVLPAVPTGTCSITPGGANKLIKGEVLTPTKLFHGGQVAVDALGSITCVGCDCAQTGETVISCPDGAISPGLINTHDHITFTQNPPYNDTGVRYDDRQQWRKGLDSKPKITSAGSATGDQIRWGELRFLMGGATSIVGSGGQAGILRNLDQAANEEGLNQKAVNFDTFPLDDSGGTRRTADCNYGGTATSAQSIANDEAYEPHTSEGVDATARNEFLCQSSDTYDTSAPGLSNNIVLGKTAMIHAIGLQPADYGAMAAAGTGLIWSPRSNITLYGETARVSVAARLGVEIALGTDWMPTGSMNLLRELACADSFNKTYLDNYFTDVQLWQMVTANAAAVTSTDDVIGILAPGKVADISIFTRHDKNGYRAVIEAEPKDVALVMRGGKILYGDDAAVAATTTAACDAVDVCGVAKRVCLMGEVGKTYSALKTSAGASIYPAFTCGQPMNEPTCTPKRPTAVSGSTIYTGAPAAGDSDGDGIADATDNCPKVFNPIRPVDASSQGNADGDADGDACDPCPTDADTTSCTVIDPNDRDHDGVPNATDNCPEQANMNQLDTDNDGKGDVCDVCPMEANPGSAGCATTIYKIKSSMVPVGTSVRVTNGLVTGKGSNGFFMQVKPGDPGDMGADNSGIFVYTGAMAPTLMNAVVGARVTVDGSVAAFQGQIELDSVTAVTVTAAGPDAPAPVSVTYAEVKTGGTRALALESVLVSIAMPGTVSGNDATNGEFTLASGGNSLVVDDYLFLTTPLPASGQVFASVTGVLALRQMASKLEPRNAADLSAGPPGLASLGPALSYARVGVTTAAQTFPTPLTVTLSGPAQGNTVVMIMSGTPGSLTVPTTVTVLNGMTTAVVPVTAVTQDADVTVTAMLAAQSQVAHVRVLGAAEAPSTVTLAPMMAAVAAGGSAQLTVTLDVPALVNTDVTLAVAPAAGTLPPMVTVLAGQSSAAFTYTDTTAMSPATITATLGASMATATVTVSTGANHLVINEVDYDQIGTDTAEYIEIYNPSAAAVPLTGKQVVLVNGSGETTYATVNLGTGTLAAGGYLVIAGANVTVPVGVTKIDPGWTQDEVQNGAPDGIALIDNTAHTLIDALSYEGDAVKLTMVDLSGFAAAVSLVEGTFLPLAVADSTTADGSLCRSPNGQDTDNAAADWRFCTTRTAGQPNP
jgi:cytosine/adenosine deaminase-related metal-dependent hydrolase